LRRVSSRESAHASSSPRIVAIQPDRSCSLPFIPKKRGTERESVQITCFPFSAARPRINRVSVPTEHVADCTCFLINVASEQVGLFTFTHYCGSCVLDDSEMHWDYRTGVANIPRLTSTISFERRPEVVTVWLH
jgi:hypothetical protein